MRLCNRGSDLSEETKQGGFMKKFIAAGLAFTAALGLAACSPESDRGDETEESGPDKDGNPVDQ